MIELSVNALLCYARTLRAESRRRSVSGPAYREHRASLRRRANAAEDVAHRLRTGQLSIGSPG